MSLISAFKRQLLLLTIFFLSLISQAQADSLEASQSHCPGSQWTITTDFLAWYASEEVASIWADVITVGDNTSSWEARGFNFKWDFGSRLGITRALKCDQWDTTFYWTWFQTSHNKKIPFEADARISPEFFAAFLSGNTPQSMSAKWSLLFNVFDWELGRCCWVCKELSVRPFIGLKGGVINQTINAKYNDLIIDNIPTNFSAAERLNNNFWGAGPLVGVNSKWKIRSFCSHSFSLLGDFSMATLFGSWTCNDFYENAISQAASVTTKKSMLGALMFKGFLGVQWDFGFTCRGTHITAKLGYEAQIWMNQLRIATFQLQRLHNDLTLQGLTLSGEFKF